MKILLLIAAALAFLLTRIRKVLAFTDGNINTATFDATGTIPEYRNPGTRQWGTKMANNAANAYRWAGRDMIINNEYIARSTELTFDTDRDYRNAYMYFRIYVGAASQALPIRDVDAGFWDNYEIIQITTTQQDLDGIAPAGVFGVKAENSGGFTIVNREALNDFYFTAVVTELRLVAGA